jgi:hypothetical protein
MPSLHVWHINSFFWRRLVEQDFARAWTLAHQLPTENERCIIRLPE